MNPKTLGFRKLLGYRFICPCCNGYFRKFMNFGLKARKNAQCPRCGALERHRLLWLYLQRKTDFFQKRMKVLEVAPQKFLQEKFKNLGNIDYLSVDAASPLAMAKEDVTNLSFEDNRFDGIICYHVLEHIPDDKKAMRELLRVLKPGGLAILQVPIDSRREKTLENPGVVLPEDRERIFGQKDHVRIYGTDYKSRLEEAGFLVVLDNFAGELRNELILTYSLMRNETLYIGFKPK